MAPHWRTDEQFVRGRVLKTKFVFIYLKDMFHIILQHTGLMDNSYSFDTLLVYLFHLKNFFSDESLHEIWGGWQWWETVDG